jgi:multiple sugar transport system permease protein
MTIRRSNWRQTAKGLAFISPWLIGFCCFTLIPVALSLYFSFCDYPILDRPVWLGADNYRSFLIHRDWSEVDTTKWYHAAIGWHTRDRWLGNSLFVTLRYAAMALPAAMCVSLGLALMLNRRIVGQSIYRTIIFLPSLVPVAASSMIWLWIFNTRLGLLNHVLSYLHIEPVPWLSDPRVALPSLAFMSVWGVGHTVVIYLAGLQDVPTELYEAAELDGATGPRRLLHVTIPMLSPVIFFNLIMAIIGTLQVFAVPYIMTAGGPVRATEFYTLYLYNNAFVYLRMGYASAMAWLQLLIILFFTAIAFWSSRHWVHYQGK